MIIADSAVCFNAIIFCAIWRGGGGGIKWGTFLYNKQNDTCMLGHIQFNPRVDKDIISTTAHSCIVLFSISIRRILNSCTLL